MRSASKTLSRARADDITDPIERREQFEWDLGMYGLFILFLGGILWIIDGVLKGGVPNDWIKYFAILYGGSALLMWSPPIRKRIDKYYKRNTWEMTDGA